MADIPLEIESNIISTQVKLLQLEAGIRIKVEKLLLEVEKELVARLTNADPTRPVRTAYQRKRLDALLKDIQKLLATDFANIAKEVTKDLEKVVEYSNELAAKAVNDALGVEIIKAVVTADELSLIVREGLVEGAPSAEWWARQAGDLREKFADEVRKGMAQGETLPDIVARIRGKRAYLDRPAYSGIMDVSRRNAFALVRTMVIAASNDAHMSLFRANDDLVRGIQWVSTLDSRTSIICRALDGLTWDLDYKPIGHDQKYPGPTAHWGCRSTQTPLLRDWTELIDNPRLAKALNDFDSGTRASIGGQVKDSTKYNDWLSKRSETEQIEILGKQRQKLFATGKADTIDMIDQRNNPRTVKQLREYVG